MKKRNRRLSIEEKLELFFEFCKLVNTSRGRLRVEKLLGKKRQNKRIKT
jgi:hypothetical protein